MTYAVRNESGLLIMKVEDNVASDIIENVAGTFRSYTTQGSTVTKTVFEITECSTLTVKSIKLYLWEKMLLIPE